MCDIDWEWLGLDNTAKGNTVAFIWSNKEKRYLGISLETNEGDCCTAISARLCPYGTPHAFESVEAANTCLGEDTPWFNSGATRPMRDYYNLDNCAVIEISLTSAFG